MIEIFKEWIQSILCIGILFTIVRIIIPNSSLKKYTYSIVGIITIIVILSPIINLVKGSDLTNLKEIFSSPNEIINENIVYTNISNYEDINKNNVKEDFKQKIEQDIILKLKSKANIDARVNIEITESYNIEKINITLNEPASLDIPSYLSQEYDIDKSIIEITKEE